MGIYECRILLLSGIFLMSESLGCIPDPHAVYLSVPEASCTFRDKTTCSYHAMPDWQLTEGESFDNHSSTPQFFLTAGQDDDFYMLFRSINNTNTSFTIVSPILPGGKYQITFWYASPGQKGLLELETVTSHAVNKLWNSGNTVQTSWAGENVTFEESSNFTITINAYEGTFVFFGLDNIEVCRACGPLILPHGTIKYNDSTAEFSCGHGYRLVGDTTLTCSQLKHDSTLPVCQPVALGNVSSIGTTYASVSTINCESGFVLNRSPNSSCTHTGEWSETCHVCVPANKTDSVHRSCLGYCTFAMNDSCTYTLDERWTIKKGTYLLMGRCVLKGGQDDDFYALFEPPSTSNTSNTSNIGNPLFSMSSSLFREGAACLSFYYTLPASFATLQVRTRLEDNSTSEMWNVSNRGIRNWTIVEGLVIWQINKYFVDFVAKTSSHAVIGIDNICFESLHCASGYNLNKSEVHGYCNKSRTGFPSCEIVDCGAFADPQNGTVSTVATTYGSTATVTCQIGYILNGSHTSQCGSDGKWSIVGQKCDPVDCGSFPALQNGSVTATSTILGSIAKITCDTGYILSGSNASMCDVNGRWSSKNQSCNPVGKINLRTHQFILYCNQLPIPSHGMVSPVATATTVGTVVTITCDTGYYLTGNSTSTCDSNGNWSSIGHICDPVQCGNLSAPENGFINASSTTYGSKAIVACNLGYNLIGTNTSICLSNGLWNNVGQICKAVDCGALAYPQNGNVSTVATTYGSTATVTCQTGYFLNGSHTSQCGRDGRWSIVGQTCDPVDCGAFADPQNGTVSTVGTTYGSTATVACHIGYILNGSHTSQCGSDGRWSIVGQKCDPIDCGSFPALHNGSVTTTNTILGSIAQITCDTGYILNGSSTSTCEVNGSWSSQNQSCNLVDCNQLPIPSHGMISHVATATTFGTAVTITCNTGYNLTGNSTSTCDSNGNWSTIGHICDLVQCGNLSAPENGIINSSSTTYGSKAIVACHLGYNLIGTNTATCDSNGEWSHIGQICTAVDCGQFPDLLNGIIDAENTTFGSIVSLMCNEGFDLIGSSRSVCTSTGDWNTTGQACQPLDCGPFKPPTNSHLSTGHYTYNSTVTIFCYPGYVLVGDKTSTCGENGNWNNADQECVLQTVFLQVKEASCIFKENNTCMCNNASSVQILDGNSTFDVRLETNDSFPFRGHGNACYIVRRDNTSIQHTLSFTMTSPALQPGQYQISFQQMFPFGEVRVDVESENNETYDQESFWKYMELDSTWMNETINLIEDKIFRIVFRANVTKNGLLGFDNINILKACDLLNISNGHIIVDKNTAYFRCNAGYLLVGNSSATCTQWTWSSEAPICELIDCGLPIAPSNGYVASNSTSYGSVSTVSCKIGYFVKGNYTGICGNNQGWSNKNTTCLSIDSTISNAIIPGCSNHGWNIAVNLTFLRSSIPNYKDEMQIYLGNASCKGSERSGFLVYDNSYYECMTRKKVSANLNIFENQMVFIFDPETSAASNAYNWTIDLHCNVVDKNIVTSVSTNQLHSDANSINTSVFIDPFFRIVLPSNPLHAHIGDTVYVKVSSPIRDPEIKLLLKSCYIRPALEKDSRLDSALIQNGCEVESSIHMISISAHEIKFMFQNYAPVALREGMNVICDVAYCNSQELTLDCNQTCNKMLAPVIVG
ncbi:sushi, von Willebrand factor type A, EGF and pentraxin domain-containing protein 1-like isoform X3 [Dreissena polymorpha]|uniref:sushi, von Willebrand factor type A, EGF and pentraxin domain-containing protein 1-like isoform X3 n=1 Tax=Dreissena polymorpha TaxID=45954 RepID=UPI002265195D|nr:sushi, von Willebrand factor type A, EGF and pentraxin domain-containing protein 1-like isoform X3 [Dreissena polymorpha]